MKDSGNEPAAISFRDSLRWHRLMADFSQLFELAIVYFLFRCSSIFKKLQILYKQIVCLLGKSESIDKIFARYAAAAMLMNRVYIAEKYRIIE